MTSHFRHFPLAADRLLRLPAESPLGQGAHTSYLSYAMALTDLRCRSEKPGPTRKKLSDGRGLQLWVQPGGAKLWQLVYQFQGRQRQMALGPFPKISLATAREQREAAKRSIREGVDPASTRPSKAPAPPHITETGATFREVATAYLAKRRRERLANATMTKKEWLIDLAMPALGNKLCKDIRPVDVLKVLQELEARDCIETPPLRCYLSTWRKLCRM